jgi:very-short-patch-repair endonuclease
MGNVKRECLVCNTITTNKKYCSEVCQYQAYRNSKLDRIEIICLNCNNPFIVKSTSVRKYCSRNCTDLHKKVLQLGENNGMFGKHHSDQTKNLTSAKMKDRWKTEEHREKYKSGISKFTKKHNHKPGWSVKDQEKRNATNIIRYGREHIWSGEYGMRKGDITFQEKYGMTSIEYASKKLRTMKKTKIEDYMYTLLTKVDIDFIFQYKFKNRFFDFGIPSLNLLIEVDGDYWHGKDIAYENLNNQQINTFRNDRYKDDLVNNSDWKLVRIWESDIHKITIKELKELVYGNSKT